MRKNNRRLFYFVFIATVFSGNCAMGDPVSQDYYAGTGKIAGGNPPSVPLVTFTPAQLRFDFTASLDPESGSEVGTYFIYTYDGIPKTFYEPRYIDLTISPPADRTFYYSAAQSGTHTVIVTGFDGYRESAVTDQNKITFTVP
jgi:hypothetical protein